MSASLIFWTAALVNLAVIVVCMGIGVRCIRRGALRAHTRAMGVAAALVGLFLLSYLVKVALLGREDRTGWQQGDLLLLYAHELCVAALLGGGGTALLRGRRLRARLGAGVRRIAPGTLPGAAAHRRAGRIARAAGVLALLTAAGVLARMYARAAG
jgi:uncharacterized membrane protein YozB (DUF420 family)